MMRNFLPKLLALAALPAIALVVPALHPSPAEAQRAGAGLCPATMPSGAAELECECPATGGGAAVWGTDYYTDDSNLCGAAVHAGAIRSSGGVIHARSQPGRDYYTGTQRNGISTRDYGAWSRTIVFDGGKSVAESEGVAICPGTYNASGTGWSGTCRCPGVGDGAVWGSGPYTADSNLCRAARHAGAIGSGGGVVRVTPAAGQASYAGTSRNGVTTSSWGSYDASFRVSAAN